LTTITIHIPEERLRLLQERAADLGITLEELLRLSIADLLMRPDQEVQQAIAYVLQKNADLYRRLA
jgi:antitoxin FitA